MLRHFVCPSRKRFDLLPVEMIQRQSTFPNRVRLLRRLHHIRFRQRRRFQQRPPRRKLRGYRRGKSASSALGVFNLDPVPAQLMNFLPIK